MFNSTIPFEFVNPLLITAAPSFIVTFMFCKGFPFSEVALNGKYLFKVLPAAQLYNEVMLTYPWIVGFSAAPIKYKLSILENGCVKLVTDVSYILVSTLQSNIEFSTVVLPEP